MFRDAVRDFAAQEVRPRTAAMEQAAQLDPTLIAKFFELGLMGIEIPEAQGGAGGSLFMTVLAVEELSAVDASTAIFVDVQMHKIKVDRYLAHDHQPARGRALLREFLVTNTKRPGGQSSCYSFCGRRRVHHNFRLARRRISLCPRCRRKTTTRRKHLIATSMIVDLSGS